MEKQIHTIPLPQTLVNQRLDKALAQLLPQYSRTQLQQWIQQGQVQQQHQVLHQRYLTTLGDVYTVAISPPPRDDAIEPMDMALDVVYEDAALLVIHKPAGLVTHPGAGRPHSTLMNALVHHQPALRALPRAGIIHRLDKDTSGLMVVAKRLESHHHLTQALQQRHIQRQYLALVTGHCIAGGSIDAPIGRDPKHRTLMAIQARGKPALTHYRVEERFRCCTLLKVTLVTGRTHQIRVHMRSIKHTLVGDRTYGYRPVFPKHATEQLKAGLADFPRQALHAQTLTLPHPDSQQLMTWTRPLPQDMAQLCDWLRQDAAVNPVHR